MKLSKRKQKIKEVVEEGKIYSIESAVECLASVSKVKFTESFDVAINLGIDTRKSDQLIRGATTLPHGLGKTVFVAALTSEAHQDQAKEAGADLVGFEDLFENIKKGEINFDVLVTTPDAMRLVGQLGPILGPKGLMPNPKTGTVTNDIGQAIKNIKFGQFQYRADKGGIVHGNIGKVGFETQKIKENLEVLVVDLIKAKPANAKGIYLKQIVLSTTMGPGLVIDQSSLNLR